ncbi:NADH-FMN oxidoreductase RutF, flavin reductase (DIM6/NTAB) family [Muriicola jejuensis]|uniref:Flavin reductase family protein n=1 Tax=Muriicola jejuensis TaxID=504488 RepID=A0A6P0UCP8_9FLAO|nr:flavin reductase family protein [Muriicola jejuensis]NER10260.1 flavin reductase family protein [Muriicola jejuensis]SMP01686.1 NADH-FMN oxidoreductase RutF, flavin reductase (DIM6/NTAB) family [Muriicola jejuensis]
MSETVTILPAEVPVAQLHGYLLGAVGPRPIAFASTVDKGGRPNLSPFSFFNVFSANPPVLIFSPARRVRDNTTKHTLENVLETREVVINVVDYDMVQQMSLASTEYAQGENEFIKAGLTMVPSDEVRPYRVGESPVQFECRVTKVEPLGEEGGAGNLVFSEVVRIHIKKAILDPDGGIDQHKIDQVARMGGNWYTRARSGMFEVPKPLSTKGMGVDRLPEQVRKSPVLTGNDLGMLGNVESLPSEEAVKAFLKEHPNLITLQGNLEKIHQKAKEFLMENDVSSAWKVLMLNQ